MMAAITPGTAYGTKERQAEEFLSLDDGGVQQQREHQGEAEHDRNLDDEQTRTRPIDDQNSPEEKTLWYCSKPPKTAVAAQGTLPHGLEERLVQGIQHGNGIEQRE